MRTVLVIFGGESPEHDISCLSTASLLENIDRENNKILELGITKNGLWFYTEASASSVKDGSWINEEKYPAFITPDKGSSALYIMKNGSWERKEFDVVFPMLHGENGEDGRIQGLLELTGKPFVGPGMASSSNSMDKSLTKIVVATANVPQADYLVLKKGKGTMEEYIAQVEHKFSYPVFVKPTSTGSSCGVSKAADNKQLKDAINNAFEYDNKILIEEFISGKEVEVAVMGGSETYASCCGQIAPANEFYDFDAKYKDDDSKLYIPARIPEKQAESIRQAAIKVFEALGCKGHSRVDFFALDDGRFILNEINTLPGFTSISMFPKLMMYSKNISYTELLDQMIDLAIEDGRKN